MERVFEQNLFPNVVVCEPVLSNRKEAHFYIAENRVDAYPPGEAETMACFFVGPVAPVLILLKCGFRIYDYWLNYFAPEGKGREILDALVDQPVLPFHYYYQARYRGMIVAENMSRNVFRTARDKIVRLPAWSIWDFVRFKTAITDRFKTKAHFWSVMAQRDQPQ